LRIEIIHRNKDLEVVGVEEFTVSEYCHLLSQKTLSLLYQIENLQNNNIEFSDIKKYIFNLAGSIQRLPENLVDQEMINARVKKPDKSFFDFLKRRDD
jgi:hypothetical protein